MGIPGNELEQFGLPGRPDLREQMLQVRPQGSFGNPEHLCNLWHAADLDDGKQDAKLRRRQ